MKLLVGTNNIGKVREIHELLADLPFELKSLQDFAEIGDVEETGATFAENAVLKAREYARQTGLWTVADDSGLAVDALGGAPGVFSARYAADNDARIKKLLHEIDKSSDKNRAARFVCVMAVADDSGEIKFTAEGVCEGKIAEHPRGNGGFGYDPVFIPYGFQLTFGELSSEIKGQISHRAHASAKIIRYLRDFVAV